MSAVETLMGNCPIHADKKAVKGEFTHINDEEFYVIKNYDSMNPFFMSICSDSNHWMFISSTGGLSAGRINPDSAIFPYYNDDKISESSETTGSKTLIRVKKGNKYILWEPFSEKYHGIYKIERNLYKNTIGNKIIFEEKNLDLGLTFSYSWMNSDRYGWIKKSVLTNNAKSNADIDVLDGLQNILPHGTDRVTQMMYSTLSDAYKKNELVKEVNLGLFRMSSIQVDRAEPSEALKVNTIWSYGLNNIKFLLSSRQIADFRKGKNIKEETESKGIKGSFFVNTNVTVKPGGSVKWYFIAEVSQDSVEVNNLIEFLKKEKNIETLLEEDVKRGTQTLYSIVADADGIQHSADRLITARHFSNALFNVMRGGIFSNGYTIESADFNKHIEHFNKKLWDKHKSFLTSLPDEISYKELSNAVENAKDADLKRLFLEYLPLTFSRRHGDPSRPWNLFSINIKDSHGHKILYYQGNWRDIFQNWEALSLSFPEYISGMIAKFVNATTPDGYNPYRITRDGIDWEVHDPNDPWSNIGYWGDHQIIYLEKLLEVSQKYFPERLSSWLTEEMFAYANVPYRIHKYEDLLKNPHLSIDMDDTLHVKIEKLVKEMGADAKLVLESNGSVKKVNLTEKLLVTLLSKLSNFIPEAGIWMNTQRPEWNDANNALVGYGVSMVTLYYIRRFISHIDNLFQSSDKESYTVSKEIVELMTEIHGAFSKNESLLSAGFDDSGRKVLTDLLGRAGSDYREKVYKKFSGKTVILKKEDLHAFLNLTQKFVDQSIDANKRDDKMYNAYNLISIYDDRISIRYLYEMLEGQTAVLSSGKLSADEALEVIEAMRKSALYREDQNSYILYPNKRLPDFLEKNVISEEDVKKSTLLLQLLIIGNKSVIDKDIKGKYHFNGNFNNANFLKDELINLRKKEVVNFSDDQMQEVLDIYEKIFDHQSFTGRSGTFYKYEGLGCIYWHMVSKLLLAVGENVEKAAAENATTGTLNGLRKYYNEIKEGIGIHKSPADYGAFPTDPYSHTPSMAGVQQPGMTGQVKEDLISRFYELGIVISDGKINIKPVLLKRAEFVDSSEYYDVPHVYFTFCKVPFIYKLDGSTGIDVIYRDGTADNIDSVTLTKEISHSIFDRDGKIEKVIVHLDEKVLI
ncbi:MAG: hypothetical protein JW894_13360 [Bacteroidales bacterium]|nr:hypothetical protein [Bacteroidales bacterium]